MERQKSNYPPIILWFSPQIPPPRPFFSKWDFSPETNSIKKKWLQQSSPELHGMGRGGALFPLGEFGSGTLGWLAVRHKETSLRATRTDVTLHSSAGGAGSADGERPNWWGIVHQMALSGWGGSRLAPRLKEGFRRLHPYPLAAVDSPSEKWGGVQGWGAGWLSFSTSLNRGSSTGLAKGLGRCPDPEGTQERVGGKSATEGEARELESKISRLVQFGCQHCFSQGSALQLRSRGARWQAHAPPFLFPGPAGFCYADGGRRLSRRRREWVGRRRGGERGGKCGSRDQPPLPTSHCERDKTRARRSSHAHAHTDDPGASSLQRCRESQSSLPFLGRGGSASQSAAQSRPRKLREPADKPSFSSAGPGWGAPSPALNPCLSHSTLLGFTRTGTEPGVPPFGIHVSALRTAPGKPGPFGLAMASVQQGEKQLFEKFWRGTFKAVATPRPESIIVASITARKPLPR